MTTVISATELKNRVSEVLNNVYFTGNETVIEKYGKPIVKIIPVKERTNLPIQKNLERG